jgi:hypothetical protein
MAKRPIADPTLHYVDPDARLAAGIGKFIVAWGDVEQQLDIAFHVLFHTDPTLAMCIYANLGTKAKIEILQSAISLQEEPIGSGLAKHAKRTLTRIADMSDKARLVTAHGKAFAYLLNGRGQNRYELVRQVARARPKITVHPATGRYWTGQANYARELAARWRYYVARIYAMIGDLSLEELEKTCGIETQVFRSPFSRHRRRPLRRRHALEDRLTKLAKWPRP